MIKVFCPNTMDATILMGQLQEMYRGPYKCGWSNSNTMFSVHPPVGKTDEVIEMLKSAGRTIYKTVEVKVYG